MLNSSRSVRGVKRISLLLSLLLFPLLALAGCGGGSSPPPTPPVTTVTISGVVQNSSGVNLEGFVLAFDKNTKLEGTSDSNGKFTVVVPMASITGSDTLTVYDPSGALAAVVKIAPSASATTYSAGTIVIGPPPPPTV